MKIIDLSLTYEEGMRGVAFENAKTKSVDKRRRWRTGQSGCRGKVTGDLSRTKYHSSRHQGARGEKSHTSGSVRGVTGNRHAYRQNLFIRAYIQK